MAQVSCRKSDIPTMLKAGPLTGSKSKQVNPTKPTSDVHDRSALRNGPAPDIKVPPTIDPGSSSHADEIVIGLALGSPGQSPIPLLPPDDRHGVVTSSCSSPENIPDGLRVVNESATAGQNIIRKGRKWKSFGSLFGRKDSAARGSEVLPFYNLDQTPEPAPAEQDTAHTYLETNARRRAQAGLSRGKIGTDSSPTTTKGESGGLLRRNSSRRKGLRRRKVQEIKPQMSQLNDALSPDAEVEDVPPSVAALQQPVNSLLQVEIPNVELDRYSIMFGDLLAFNRPYNTQSKQQASLLARSQSHAGELPADIDFEATHKCSIDGLQKASHQRDNSNSSKSSKIQSFSLFPSSTSTPRQLAYSTVNKPLPKPSPLGRSTTAPSTFAPSELPQIHKNKSNEQNHVLLIVHDSVGLPSTSTSDIPRNSLDSLRPSINSTQASFLEHPGDPGCLSPTADVDPPNITGKYGREVLPLRKSSMKKSQQSLEELGCTNQPQPDSVGTEISIARQISILRRQQQLLVPVTPKLARQPRQPRLVDGVSNPAARKSHHLKLEDA